MRPDLHHRLKVAAAVHRRDMSEILGEGEELGDGV